MAKAKTKATFRFPIKESVYKLELDDINLSQRATNCIHRAGMFTVEDVIDNKERLMRTKGVGVAVMREVLNAILKLQFETMTEEQAKQYEVDCLIENKTA